MTPIEKLIEETIKANGRAEGATRYLGTNDSEAFSNYLLRSSQTQAINQLSAPILAKALRIALGHIKAIDKTDGGEGYRQAQYCLKEINSLIEEKK